MPVNDIARLFILNQIIPIEKYDGYGRPEQQMAQAAVCRI